MLRASPLLVASVAGWSSCDFPNINWLAVDTGFGKSATQKVTSIGDTTFIGGYAGGATNLTSSIAGNVRAPRTRARPLVGCIIKPPLTCARCARLVMHSRMSSMSSRPQPI